MANVLVDIPDDLLQDVQEVLDTRPEQFRPAPRKRGNGSRAEFIRQAVSLFIESLTVQTDSQTIKSEN